MSANKSPHNEECGGVFYAAISCATSGADNTIVAAVTGKKIRVLSMFLIAASAVTVLVRTAASASLTGTMSLPDNGGIVLPHNPHGWFHTVAGEALKFTLGGAIQVSGALVYQVVE